MKVGEFEKHLASFSKILAAGNAVPIANEIKHLCTIFTGQETLTLANFIKLATPSNNIEKRSSGILLSDLLKPLHELELFLTPCSKQAFLKDLRQFIVLLEGAKNTSVTDFICRVKEQLATAPTVKRRTPVAVNTTLVEEYVQRLKSSYKDADRFKIIYEELKSNRAVRKQEAAAISDKFAFTTPPSTAKKTSLARIKSVHQHYHSSVLREKAMGGRSAA